MSKPNLYEVEITYTVMVAAESESEAERYANQNIRDITRDEPPFVQCVGRVAIVGREWQGTIAWGDNPDELTCESLV